MMKVNSFIPGVKSEKKLTPFFQPKIAMNQANDIYEQEADTTADKVIGMPFASANNNLFFKPAISSIQCKCAHCEDEEKQAQRKEINNNITLASAQTEDYNNSFSHKYTIQPKLTINQPNDIYVQEADAVADKVMYMPDNTINNNFFFRPAISSTQRKCAHCEEKEKKEKQLQRKESNGDETSVDTSTENYISSLNGKGRLLNNEERSFFEPRFGYDFSNVKIHTDDDAAKSAQSINSLAYTAGNSIVFNKMQFSPDTNSGKRLLAHELTHVVQQSNHILPKLIQRDGPTGDPAQDDPSYRSPTYVQPGGPFDVNDNIFTLQWSSDGLKFGFPIPGAAPGADNASLTLFCPRGQRRVIRTGECCPPGRYNPLTDTCCDDGQVPMGSNCADPASVTVTPSTVPPTIPSANCDLSQMNILTGECCTLPLVPYLGHCINPNIAPTPPPPAQGISGIFPAGTIDDFDIDAVLINSRQTVAYQSVLANLRLVLQNCPTTIVTVTGFTDAPGTAEHNAQLAQNRADSVKSRLQLDLLSQHPLQSLIIAVGRGSVNPVDISAGTGYSARNRRVEVEMSVQCPPLSLSPH